MVSHEVMSDEVWAVTGVPHQNGPPRIGSLTKATYEPAEDAMRQIKQLAGTVLFVVALAGALTACSPDGDLEFSNEGPEAVTVSTGDQEFTVDADGGVVILDYGCSEDDISVQFPSGQETVLSERVCPGQQVVIGDGTVDLQPSSSS